MKKPVHIYASFPVFLAFLCMGFGDVVGPLTGLVKEEFQLSNVAAQLIPFMGFLMFGVLSVPIGVIQDKLGRKTILMIGLLTATLGLSIPYLAGFSTFGSILLGILMLGAGATFLQVSGNPLMRDVSSPGKFARNLSLAQFIKAIGTLSGALIPLIAVNYWGGDWRILFPVYIIILLITMILLMFQKIKEHSKTNLPSASLTSTFLLLKNKYVLLMVSGIFLYVGAEVSMSSGLPIYLQDTFGLDIARLGLLGTLFFFIALMSGRFLGAIMLNWIPARYFLKISVIISLTGFIGLFAGVQIIAMISIFLLGLGFANIFPLIFSITVESLPERSNELSGLMVAAIVGGAVVPLLMGYLADLTSPLIAFAVPLSCLLFITILAFFSFDPLKPINS